MMFKKFASLALAGALSFSLAAPAFAATNTETEITATYTAPVIKVIVPQTATAFINPLGLDVEVATGVNLTGRQIITAPMAIKNESASDLQVGASMTTTVGAGSDMRFVSTTTGGTGATKTVFAYLQAKQEATLTGATVADTAVATAYGNWAASAYNATTDLLANTAMPATKDNLVVLRAADVTGTTFNAYKAGSIALVRLAGDCVATPTTGSWAATTKNDAGEITGGDSFTVNVAYTFKPATIAKYAVTTNMTGITTPAGEAATVDTPNAAAGDTVTLTVTMGGMTNAAPSATTAGGDAITFTPDTGASTATTKVFTFTMPAEAITINVAFS